MVVEIKTNPDQISISEPEELNLRNVFFWMKETRDFAVMAMHNKKMKAHLDKAIRLIEKNKILLTGRFNENLRWKIYSGNREFNVYYGNLVGKFDCECKHPEVDGVPCHHILAAMALRKLRK